MTRPEALDHRAVEDAVRDMIDRERARVDDPGAAIPGVDPDDVHGWHGWSPDRVVHPREPGMPVFHPECWRFFRLLGLAWFGDALLVGFAWDELGTPNLHYLTLVRFMAPAMERGPRTLALTVRGELRYLLAPTDLAVMSGPRDAREAAAIAAATAATASWRGRCGRLWLSREHVLVGSGAAADQQGLDVGWELPWPSLTNPPGPHRSAPGDSRGLHRSTL